MEYDTILAEKPACPDTVEFKRPVAHKPKYHCSDTFMRRYYSRDSYCPSNENDRILDKIKRPY